MALTTLIVSFDSDADAERVFHEQNLIATRVSTLMCRYAIEVPASQEEEMAKLLREQYGARVNDNFLSGSKEFRGKKFVRKRLGENQ